MANRSAEIISKEMNEKMIKRTELLNAAKVILIKELNRYDSYSCSVDEEKRTLALVGKQYGKAYLDFNDWFGRVREQDPPEYLARDMMEDLKNQLLPERDYSM